MALIPEPMFALPSLLTDKSKATANIRKMAAKMPSLSMFRPHFKTHQSEETGQWFKEAGIEKITVSSPQMAAAFIHQGWHDITIAFPLSIHWVPFINAYAAKVSLNIIVEDVDVLKSIISGIKVSCGVFIKIDVGTNRTGICVKNKSYLDTLVQLLEKAPRLQFKGFLAHAGHTYHAKNPQSIEQIYFASFEALCLLKTKYMAAFSDIIISYGDTPSCSIIPKLTHFDEYRPGNFVYYDLMQYHLGSCHFEDIAVCVQSPVVAKHLSRNEIVLHGGAIHLSKEYIKIDVQKIYGELVSLNPDNTWVRFPERAYITSLSQEHAVSKVPTVILNQIKPGDILGIIPVHSCLTVHQMLNLY